MTQEDVAREAHTTGATVSRWENYPSRVTVPVLQNLARIFDVSPSELLAGIKSTDMTSGTIVMVRDLSESRPSPFDVAELESLTETPADSLAMLRIRGDAMSPTLDDGDRALVDISDRNVSATGIYCIQLGQTAQARRLSLNPVNGFINIICDNPTYEKYTDVQPNAITVIGRIVWVGGKIK